MKAQLQALYALQQVDVQIAAARKALAELDSGVEARQKIAAIEKRYSALSEELRKSESELQDNELNLKSIETKKSDFEQKLYAGKVTNPKELSSIEKEIEMLGKSRSKLDERILELYDVVENQRAEVAKYGKALVDWKKKLDSVTAHFQSKSDEYNSTIARLTDERQTLVTAVTDRALLQRYESIRARYKDTGMAKVEDGRCGGCHVGLTSYSLRAVKEDGQYQTCESCGRILFQE